MKAPFFPLIGAITLLCGCAPKKPVVVSHPAAPRIGQRVQKLLRLECFEKIVPDPAKWHCVVTDNLDGITCEPGSYVFKTKPGSSEANCIEIHVLREQ